MIKNFNNKTDKVGDDLKKTIVKGSKIDVAASIFSIYGFNSLKNELRKIDHLRFIFTDPTFIEIDKNNREQRMFELVANKRKKAISGTDFEINLKNELKGRNIAKECRKWIEKKVTFKTNTSHRYIQPQLIIKGNDPNEWRKDQCGAWIGRRFYGDRNSQYGWEIDHIISVDSGGTDSLSNLRPLQWVNNASRQEGKLTCPVVASGSQNVRR